MNTKLLSLKTLAATAALAIAAAISACGGGGCDAGADHTGLGCALMPRVTKARPKPPPPRLDDAQVGGTHYAEMAVTPWQFLEACMTPDELRGYLKGEVIVYLARERKKGAREDLKKAAHTLQKLLEVTG